MSGLFSKRLIGVLALAAAVAACDDTPTPVTPTPAPPVTVTFAGTVTANGAATHNFNASAGGTVTATLRTIGGDNTLVIGLSLGNWNATTSTCSIVLANDAATGGSVLTGGMTNFGALCVRIYDVGNIVGAPVAYSIEVVHP